MDLLTEMRVPTRAAPRPPPGNNALSRNSSTSSSSNNLWGSSNDLFGSSLQVPQKKKPPPRPPPPKFPVNSVYNQEKPKKPTRPTELLTNLFGRRGSKQHNQQNTVSNTTTSSTMYSTSRTTNTTFQLPPPKTDGNSMCLIDLSPPGSPTFTTRSSSDGVSVDSFGSDGNSNPSVFTSSGSTSQTESAFEDDFDFFGSLSSNKKNFVNDPWKVSCSQDPFGSLESNAFSKASSQQWPTSASSQQQEIKEIGDSNFFAFNDTSPFDQPAQVPPAKPISMPTIIRPAKPRKSAAPQPKISTVANTSNSGIYSSTRSTYAINNYSSAPRLTPKEPTSWDDDPPMPAQPPPPPPPEYIAGLEDGLVENSARPYGVALYDFPASQPGDLDLKEGDVVYLTKLINDSWMEGRVGSREGMFPVNFVDVKIPLPGLDTNVVNALYAFKAETSDDLSFEEGARIKVLSRISDDWLYGEHDGRKGQFPANFVDKIPTDLPLKHL
ncbi:hypothetical protein TSAR_017063 [Trichomalopsis sarcophagae]|uniref:SH3 domain-containing protein n=1 Tax=Trichomalopsis sarcophagae TaxID=543379 RepID=A0A232FH54_9HYME|nr:hypothetical protein TSAR_017063 [Trichomalopsis sarcophagae]